MLRHFSIKALKICAALLILHLVLIQPNHPLAVSWGALLLFPLELPAIVFALMAFKPGRVAWVLRLILVAVITLIAALKGADFGMFTALNRGFNPVADLPLIVSLYQLVEGTFGSVLAVLAALAAIASVIIVAMALWWATGIFANLQLPKPASFAAAGLASVAMAIVVIEIGDTRRVWTAPVHIPGTAFTARVGLERYEMILDTLIKLNDFRTAASNDPFANQANLLDLVDRDVVVVFLESYGRTSFDTPLYADLHLETLGAAEQQLTASGLSIASTFLKSPTQGGQSWLAHSSFANGLWIDNQISYGAALNSDRQTLFHLAAKSGFHTAAVMPQITLDWPEAQFMGFDTILAAKDLGYKGKAFNWITMPDQFTYAAMDRLLRVNRPNNKHMFIQIATGSSHAPWVPVPDVIDWDTLGDGTVFNPIVEASDTPREVWRDHDRVRQQYKLAVDYALRAVFAYAQLHAKEPPLILLIGDHQAAEFVALDARPDVPMHVIGPHTLVDLIADDQFTPGLIPQPVQQPRLMSELRAHLLRSLSSVDLPENAQ